MITYKTGDLLEFTEDAFAHGCNCQSTMGSGVAKAVKSKFPDMYFEADCKSQLSPKDKLGTYTYSILPNAKIGYNIYSQLDYKGRNIGVMDLDYGALERGLASVCFDMKLKNLKTLALPKIGAGLAGGDWNVIEGIINRVSDQSGIQVTIYTL